MTIRAVLFDMDGVLVDTGGVHHSALNTALVENVCPPILREQHDELYDGLPTSTKLQMLVGRGLVPPEKVTKIADAKRVHTARLLKDRVAFDPEAYCLLAGLEHAGKKLAVVSNAVRETVLSVCKTLRVIEFTSVFLTNEDGPPKPAPDIYRLACSKLGLPPSECLAVEDGRYGVEAARAAGCRVLKVRNRSEVTAANLWRHLC